MNVVLDSSACSDCFVCSKPISREGQPYNDIGWTDYGIFHGLHLYHCSACGFGFSAPELPKETVNSYYEKQYRAKHSTFYIDFSKAVPRSLGDISHDRSFAQIVLARAYCKFDGEDVFLDIGPGRGGSFKIAKALLPRPQLYGIELSEGVSEFYRKNYGASTYQSVSDFIASGKRATFLLMSHSLEHYRLADLTELFSVLRTALAEDGVLIIEVPHVDLRIHREVRGVDTPHVLFFSRQSLALMLDKFGFDVLFMDTCGHEFRAAMEQKASASSLSSNLKKHLKPTYNKLPMRLQVALRTIVRTVHRVRNGIRATQNETVDLPIQSYGGNRDCIRVVARKKRFD